MPAARPYISSLKQILRSDLLAQGANEALIEQAWLILFDLVQHEDLNLLSAPQIVKLLEQNAIPTAVAAVPLTATETNARELLIGFVRQHPLSQREILLGGYLLALKDRGCSKATIKNYLSDIRQFFAQCSEPRIETLLTETRVQQFIKQQEDIHLAASSIRRKLTTIAQYAKWLQQVGVIETELAGSLYQLSQGYARPPQAERSQSLVESSPILAPDDKTAERTVNPITKSNLNDIIVPPAVIPAAKTSISRGNVAIIESHSDSDTNTSGKKLFLANTLPFGHFTRVLPKFSLLGAVTTLALLLSILGLGLFTRMQLLQNVEQPLAYPTALTPPTRSLSFQGRLTDEHQNPITGVTDINFKLYDSGPSTSGGTELWSSGVCNVDPDQDGIFSVGLGDDCGAAIGSDVFSENTSVWLQITVGTSPADEILSPRQPIKAVAYALNSETVQGYPASASAVENTILVMNNSGEVVLGNSTPKIKATSANGLTIEGQALNLTTTAGSNGNIVLNPDGLGSVVSTKYFAAPGATLSATYAGGNALTVNGALEVNNTLLDVNNSAGTNGQILSSTATGIDWIDASTFTDTDDQTLAEVLTQGNTTSAHNIVMSTTDELRFYDDDNDSRIYSSADGTLNLASTTIGIDSGSWDITGAGAGSGFTTFSLSGQLTSTLASGTAPFVVASNTVVTNLNADLLDGYSYDNLPYLPTGTDNWVNTSGDTMTGSLNFSGVASDITTATNEHLALMPAGTGNVGVGTTTPAGFLTVEKSAYTQNAVVINNGVTGAPPTIPNSYLSTLTVAVSKTNASRPLFFGYDNGSAWEGYINTGACGAFTSMCFNMGNGADDYTALKNVGTTLYVGGGNGVNGDGDFASVLFFNTGNVGIGTTAANYKLDVNGTGHFTSTLTTTGISNTGALTSAGGAVSLNDSSNFAVTIGTGTTTSAVTLGGGSNDVIINSDTWDVSSAGVASGLTGLSSSGTITFSGLGTAGLVTNTSGGVLGTTATIGASYITADTLDFTEFKDALALDVSSSIATAHDKTLTFTSELTAGARTANAFVFSQANDASNNATAGNLVYIEQLDTASAQDTLTITSEATGALFKVNDRAGDTTPFIVDRNGNVGVGVGTTLAAARFDIAHLAPNITANNDKLLQSVSTATYDTTAGALTNYGNYISNGATRVAGANDLTNIGLYVNASGAQVNYAALFAGGNVGIGTTAPGYLLDVNGTGRFTGAVDLDGDVELNSTLTDVNGSVGTAGQILSSTSTGVDWIDAASFTDNYADSLAFNTGDGVFTLGRTGSLPDLTVDLDGRYTLSGTDDWIDEIGDTITGSLNFSNVASDITTATNEHLALMPAGTGNVGISTTTPTAKLDIAGSASTSGTLAFRGTTDPKLDVLNGEAFGIRTSVGGDAGLSERLTILNNGNVGIGTTNPVAKLYLRNDAGAPGTTSIVIDELGFSGQDAAKLQFNFNGNEGAGIRAYLPGGNNSAMVFATNNAGTITDQMIITSLGNVGIGTTTAPEKLTLSGSATISGTLALGPKPPVDAGTCNAAAKGKQYMNGVDNIMYFCNGTAWTSMADTDTDNYADSVAFNTADGIFTLGRTGALPDLTVDLDGRYLAAEADTLATVLGRGHTTSAHNIVMSTTDELRFYDDDNDSRIYSSADGTLNLASTTIDINSGAWDITGAGAGSGFTTFSLSGQLTSTLASGTAPFVVASNTVVTNLNADLLDGISSASFLRSDATDDFTSGTLGMNSGTTLDVKSGATLDVNGNLAIADTDIALDGATANLNSTGNFSINTDDLFVEKTSGNVGVGTTSPTASLDFALLLATSAKNKVIETSVDSQSDGYASAYYSMHNTISASGFGGEYPTAVGIYNELSSNSQAGTTGMSIYAKTVSGAGWGGHAYGVKYETNYTSTGGTQYAFYTDMTSGTATKWGLYLSGEANNYLSGNVGIGDNTPTYKLDVNGTGRFTGAVDLDGDVELNSTLTDVNGSVGTNGQILSSTATGVDWIDAPSTHNPVTLGAIGSAPNANGMTLSTQVLNLEPANETYGGVVTTLAQTFAGDKTFVGDINVNGDNINSDGTLGILGATGLNLQATTGTVTIDSIAAAQTLTLGGSNVARTINIGTGTGIDTIHIGDGANGADVITIGSANAGAVTVRSGAALSLIGSTGSLIDFTTFEVNSSGIIAMIDSVAHTIDDVSGDLTLTSNSTNIAFADNISTTGDLKLSGADILDTNGNEFVRFTAAASAVNELTIGNAAANGTVTLAATGGDAAIALSIDAKGADPVNIAGTSTGGVAIAGSGTGDVTIAGGTGSTGCTITNSNGDLACTGTITAGTITATALPFSGISSATNTTAAMVVGAGASLNYTSTGTINASSLIGATWAAPGAIGTGTAAAGNFTSIGVTSQGSGAFTTLTSSGASTIGTGNSLTNTFGSGTSNNNTIGGGASSVNTIGSVTTPGALTLHGATTLDNTFTVSGSHLTSLGGNLTVTGTAWTATPTISGAVTMTSGFDSNAASTVAGLTVDSNGNLSVTNGTLSVTAPSTTGNAGAIVANALTTGSALDLTSTSTAGGASGVSKVLNIARSGANAQLAHTAYGVYSTVTNTNVTSGTNVAGYFSASGATTANYGLIVAAGNVGIGTTTPSNELEVNGDVELTNLYDNDVSNFFDGGCSATQTVSGIDATGAISCTTISGVAASSIAFSGITSATNTSAAMVVGAGASLNYTSTGTINASSLIGATWVAPGAIGSTTPNSGAFTTLGSTGATTLGNNTANVTIDSNIWDITGAGVASGLTGLSSSGTVTFSGLSTAGLVTNTSGGVLGTTATIGASYITADSLDFTEFKDAMALDVSSSIATANDKTLTFTSDLTAGARTANAFVFSQANDASNNATAGNLVYIEQLDTASAQDTLTITSEATGALFKVNDRAGDTTPFIIDRGGNVGVGVGTTTATARFDIAHLAPNITANNDKLLQSVSTATYDTTAGALTNYGNYISNTATRVSGANNLTNIGLYVNASGAQVNYSALFAGGNVGIGTTTPSNELEVNGDVELTNLYDNDASNFFDGGCSATQTVSGIDATGAISCTTISGVAASSVAFSGISSATNTTAAMVVGAGASLDYTSTGTINASSLIGATWAAPGTIGSTTPNTGAFTTLSSTGATTLGNNSANVTINSNVWDITGAGVASGLTGFSSSGTITLSGLTADRLVSTTTGGQLTTSISSANAALSVSDESGSGLMVFNNAPTFSTGSVTFSGITNDVVTGTNEHFSIMPNGTGNVGIGTTTPSNTLYISQAPAAGTKGITLFPSDTTAGGRLALEFKYNNGTTIGSLSQGIGTGTYDLLLQNTQNSTLTLQTGTTTSVANQIVFNTAGANERMRIDKDGYVGIGTTTPTNLLSVGDDLSASSVPGNTFSLGNTDGDTIVQFGQSNSYKGFLRWNYNSTPASAFLEISTSGGGEILIGDTGTNTNVGIGTSAPATRLDVEGSIQVTLAETGTEAVCAPTNGGGTNQTLSSCSGTPGADYMEMYAVATGVQRGEILAASPTEHAYTKSGDKVARLVRTTTAYQPTVMGVVSNPDDAYDFNSIGYNIKDEDNPMPVALKGRVKVRVNSSNGAIKVGDYITTSSSPGVGMKSTKAGMVIGQALESYTSADPNATGLVMIFIATAWHDPHTTLADNGDVSITSNNGSYIVASPTSGSIIQSAYAAAKIFGGTILSGLVNTKDLVVTNTASIADLSAGSIKVAGQSLQAYIENVVNNMQLNNAASLPDGAFVSELNVGQLNTEDLSASGSATLGQTIADSLAVNNDASISGNLTVASDATIAGQLNTGVLQTDELEAGNSRLGSLLADSAVLGTTTISGTVANQPALDVRGSARMQALEAQVANLQEVRALTASLYDATVSGTLYANTIAGLDEKVAAGLQPTLLQQLIGYDPAATNSAQIIAQITGIDLGTQTVIDPVALADLPTDPVLIGANAGFIEQYLQVNGNAAFGANILLAGNLNMTSGMSVAGNTISYTPVLPESCLLDSSGAECSTTLKIQPTGEGALDLMNGLALLENGTVTVTGDVTFTKSVTVADTLFTDLISPTTFDQPIQVKVAGVATESGELKQTRFEIINELDAPVATISAQGKAAFAGGISVGRDDTVSPDASGSARVSKSSGKAIIPAGATQIRLLSAQIEPDTLIYVTAQGDTANQSLYIKSQTIGEAVIGFNTALPTELKFNWWIVE